MKKLTPILMLVGMMFLLFLSWKNIATFNDKKNAEYALHIENAEKYEKKEIYIDAVSEYKAALRMEPTNYDLAMKIVDLYDKLDDSQNYISACQDAISADSSQWKPYELLSDYYIVGAMYKKAYTVLHSAQEALGDTPEISERLKTVMSMYTELSIKYDEVYSFHYQTSKSSGYAKVKSEDLYGLMSEKRTLKYKCKYEDVGFFSDGVTPIKLDGEYYYIDENGYRKLVPDESADYLGTFQDGYAPACFGGVYGYIDKSMEKYKFEYSYAGPISNGIAAVQKDGKWAIINSLLENVTGFEFDNILLDDYGYCTTNGLFFAEKNNKYFLYNKEGTCLSDGFEDAKMFVSNEPAAVKQNGKWGYVSNEGKIVIEPKYDDACSYNVGYAPFKKGNKWGYMNSNGEALVEPTFDRLDSFAKNGYGFAIENGEKKYIVVTIYE